MKAQSQPEKDIRTIRTCVLEDDEYPVKDSLIFSYLSKSFSAFKENVGIEFERIRKRIKGFPDVAMPRENTSERNELIDQKTAIYLNTFCPDDSEIRIIFSNYKHPKFRGWADDKQGVVIIFYANRVKTGAPKTDRANNPATVTLLNHEIGHLFIKENDHTDDINSFMYGGVLLDSSWSYGRWTKETRKRILEGKWREWKLGW